MTITTLLAYSFALFVAALIPGPGIAALVARALGAGFVESFAMAVGLMIGDAVFLTAVVLGLSVVAQTFGTAFMVIKYAGVLYLAWMAYKIWTAGIMRTDIEAGPKRSVLHSFASGLFVTLGNPKPMLFYVALVPTLVNIETLTLTDYFTLLAATFTILLVVTVPYIALAARARELLRQPKALKYLNRLAASFLAGTAGYIAIRAN
ncbi:LysE family translocator [Rhizobium sp. KVB221]|uniref:LysE family translocator n=1 Tax=Rhizobium setariae TaxID=2801340 RepID=A0A936YJN3_9HYPH|nr:LysE family translocator [Rhizobium setariae]MBL0371579.1 LysE family translocator [Rhizobium setariae]